MKIEVSKDKATRLINCGEVVMVSCGYKDKRNVTTCAWHMPVSRTPAAVSVALAKKHFSSEIIRKSEEFIVNIPSWPLLDKVIACGSLSGWNIDKLQETGLTGEKAHSLLKAFKISECLGHLECSLFEVKETGDHFLFLGEVVYAQAEEEFFINDCWDTARAELIFHLGGKNFFKSSPFIEYKRI